MQRLTTEINTTNDNISVFPAVCTDFTVSRAMAINILDNNTQSFGEAR